MARGPAHHARVSRGVSATKPHCSHGSCSATVLWAAKLAGENANMSFDHENLSSSRSLQSQIQRSSLFALIVLGAACGSMGKPHFQTYGMEKAAFDMQCDKEKLDVVELSSISVGVRGCGKQARYEMLRSGEWVLNSAEGASASGK